MLRAAFMRLLMIRLPKYEIFFQRGFYLNAGFYRF